MIWHIAKREIYDNLNSLRFALATLLLVALMLTNAVLHLREHPERIQRYRTSVTDYWNTLTSRTNLYALAQEGPGLLYKKPSPLRFCAEGGEDFLSDVVDASRFGWSSSSGLKGFWRLEYPSAAPNLQNIRSDAVKIDWGFIAGYVLSLIAILFTFDSISGERERGTLRLILANSMPRHTVLIGKFLGALLSIFMPFTLAVLINLFVIYVSGDVHLDVETWRRLSIIFFLALLYTGLFIALGLLISARVRQSAVGLVILLLTWVTFVVFSPGTLASIASRFSPAPMTADDYRQRQTLLMDEVRAEEIRIEEIDPSMRMLANGRLVIDDAERNEKLNEEHLTQQIAQVKFARSIIRISPASLVQHLLESFAGTGFNRHLQFLENVKRYAHQYREFVTDTDSADPDSPHIIGVREGMSRKPVSPDSIPRFEDILSLGRDFNAVTTDLLLLAVVVVILMSGAYLAFLRAQV